MRLVRFLPETVTFPAMRRIAASALALLLLGTACTSTEPAATSTSLDQPTTTAPPAPTTTTLPQTTTSTAPTIPVLPDATQASIGDPTYPGLGNAGYDVQHYDIDLVWQPEPGAIGVVTTVEAIASTDLAEFNLDFRGFDIERLAVDGAPASFERRENELVIQPETTIGAGTGFTTEITYSGIPEPIESVALPLMGWFTGPEGEQFVVAEPDAAHSWFPSNDHPLDKATFTISVTTPPQWLGVANGALIEETDDIGSVTRTFAMSDPMTTYLATVVIGEGWQIVEDEAASTPEVAIRHVLPADLRGANTPPALLRTGEMIAVLEEQFGPYPFDEYGIAVVGGFSGALENQTLSVFGRDFVEAPIFEYVLVHELAHQWFGDSVTVALWEDIWLHEGFATYAELIWAEHLHGSDVYREVVAERYAAVEQAGYPPPGAPSGDNLFNGGVYQRGALTLHALRQAVGDDTFYAILRTFASRFAYGNATTDEFIALAEELSGVELDELFDAWLYQPELPPLP